MRVYKLSVLLYTLMFICNQAKSQVLENITLQEGLNTAKKSGKYLLVDCYASWCVICKQMERDIKSNSKLSEIIKDNFLVLKMRIDNLKPTNNQERQLKNTTDSLKKEYNISAFPTCIFYSPNGVAVHLTSGYEGVDDFARILNLVHDSNFQILTSIMDYFEGKRKYEKMPEMVKILLLLNDAKRANEIGLEYISHGLLGADDSVLLNPDNLQLVLSVPQTIKIGDRYYNIFINYSKYIDSALKQDGASGQMINYLVRKDEIINKFYSNGLPIVKKIAWKSLNKKLNKYKNYIDVYRLLLDAKIEWYKVNKVWNQSANYSLIKIKRGYMDGGLGKYYNINNFAWYDVFLNVSKKSILLKTIAEMKIIVNEQPQYQDYLDTYSNLLYKVGNVKEAIYWEEKTLELATRNGSSQAEEFSKTLAKMKNGIKTW